MERKGNKKIIIGVVIAVLLVAILGIVYVTFSAKSTAGSKEYTLSVVDDKGNEKTYNGRTDAEFLKQLVEELDEASEDFSLEGTESDYGLFVTAINGLTADYDKDGAYWSIYVNGEYGMYGIDAQPVADGDDYKFVYEVYSAE